MGDYVDKTRQPRSLNQLHNLYLSASKSKPTGPSFSEEVIGGVAEGAKTKKQVLQGRRRLCKAFDTDDDITAQNDDVPLFSFDSPSPEQVRDEGYRSSSRRTDDVPNFSFGSLSPTQPDEVESIEPNFCAETNYHGPQSFLGLERGSPSPSSTLGEMEPSITELQDVFQGDSNHSLKDGPNCIELTNSGCSFQGAGEMPVKVKIQGRRRLCKILTNHDGNKKNSIETQEREKSGTADFDSPPERKNLAEHEFKGGNEILDILSDLSARLEDLSIQKRKVPSKVELVESSKGSEKLNNLNQKNSEFESAATTFSLSSDSRSDDDNDCIVVSGRSVAKEVEKSRQGKFKAVAIDDSDEVSVLDDYAEGFGAEVTLSGPKATYRLPGKIAKMLYPHQREGLKWLWSLHCQRKGGILGDDMGLGKTMQICGFLAGLFHSNLIKRVLVVAPKTLLPHWIKELSAVGLSGKTKEYFGTCARARQYELQYILQDGGILLTTYDIVRNNVKSLSGENYYIDEESEDDATWDYMILDEGHLIKNPSTQRAKSLLAVPCRYRIIISGTPIQNNLKELWALFNFCCPGLLGDKKWFKDQYESHILRGNDKNASDREKRVGSTVAKELREQIQPYFLRRLKSEVFCEDENTSSATLSKKNEIIVWLKLTGCQRQLYEAFLKSELVLSAFDGSPLAALTILKKICDHPLLLTKRAAEDVLEGMDSIVNPEDHDVAEKLAMHIADVAERIDFVEKNDVSCKISFISSLLDDLIPKGHSVLIFSQTRKMLNLIQDSLLFNGYEFTRIDGTTKASDRLKLVNDFQEGHGAPIFLLTSQVGGLGLTLTRADRVIVVDPAWNPSTDNQSVDRAYRIGQKKDVIVYRLMTCGTVEEKIYRKQIYKGGLFKTATEHKEQIRYFSQQDLRELFSIPKQGYDISLTQQQLHKEHDHQHSMEDSLRAHIDFLESLGIAGVSQHSLLFSKAAPAPVPGDHAEVARARGTTFVQASSINSSRDHNVDGSQYAFKPKDVKLQQQQSSYRESEPTETDIRERINRLSQVFANKATVSRLPDKGERIQRQIEELKRELHSVQQARGKKAETVDDISGEFQRIVNV